MHMKRCEAVAIGLIFGAALLLLGTSRPDAAASSRPGYADHHQRQDP